MTPGSFTEEDYKTLGEFLNYVTEKMDMKQQSFKDALNGVRLLGFMQNTLANKVRQNILELQEHKQAPTKTTKAGRSSRGRSKATK